MFPLATPTTSGLWIDGLTLAIVFLPVCAFVLGLADLWRAHAPRAARDLDAVTLGAYGMLGLVGLAVVVMLAGARGIPVAQAAFLAVAARGALGAARRAPRLWRWWKSASGDDLFRAAVVAAAAGWSLWLWTDVFRDHVALPGIHDGVAHAAWYLNIVEAGIPTLGRVPIGWASIFGTQLFDFYPTGTHSLIAITSGFWGQWGVLSHAGILKAWMTLTVAGMPWALFWFVRRLMPAMPWWTGVGLVFAATPGFRFPVEAAHEGGLSRLLAHVVMMPIYADVLAGRFSRWRSVPLAGLVLGIVFLMHPSAFVTLAVLFAYSAMAGPASGIGWRRRLAALAGACGVIAVGGLLAFALLAWNGSAAAARDAVQTFSWPALGSRLRGGWSAAFDTEYGMGPIKQALVVAGFVVLVVRRRALGLSWRVAGLPVVMLLLGVLAVSAQLVSLPGFRLLGGAFYDETPRVIELMYESIGLCLVALAWSVWRLAAGRSFDSGEPVATPPSIGVAGARSPLRAKTAAAVAVGFVLGAVTYAEARSPWVHEHVTYWDQVFFTPRISRLQALGTWLQRNTETDAIVFHPPFDSEIWQAWTGRRGSFMYGECHVHNQKVPCNARKILVNHRIDALRDALVEPAPETRCLQQIDRFARPAYFVVPTPYTSTRSFAACSDATYILSLDGHAVIAYQPPAH